jgi:hypothetical protein
MLSRETLESYRQMTPAERLRLTIELCRWAWRALTDGPPETVERRFQRLQKENELRNRRITAGLVHAEQRLRAEDA